MAVAAVFIAGISAFVLGASANDFGVSGIGLCAAVLAALDFWSPLFRAIANGKFRAKRPRRQPAARHIGAERDLSPWRRL